MELTIWFPNFKSCVVLSKTHVTLKGVEKLSLSTHTLCIAGTHVPTIVASYKLHLWIAFQHTSQTPCFQVISMKLNANFSNKLPQHLLVTCCSLYTMCTCNWGWSELNLFQKHKLNNMFNRIINLLSFSHIIFPISNIKRMYEHKLFHFTSSSRVNFHILKFSILTFSQRYEKYFS